MVGMRYHSCAWAVIQGIPFIALSYDPKVTQIAMKFGQPYIQLEGNRHIIENFQNAFQELLANQKRFRERLIQERQQTMETSALHLNALC